MSEHVRFVRDLGHFTFSTNFNLSITDRQTRLQTDRGTVGQMDGRTDGQTNRQMDEWTDWQWHRAFFLKMRRRYSFVNMSSFLWSKHQFKMIIIYMAIHVSIRVHETQKPAFSVWWSVGLSVGSSVCDTSFFFAVYAEHFVLIQYVPNHLYHLPVKVKKRGLTFHRVTKECQDFTFWCMMLPIRPSVYTASVQW